MGLRNSMRYLGCIRGQEVPLALFWLRQRFRQCYRSIEIVIDYGYISKLWGRCAAVHRAT